jgi:hypothetical protein
VFASCWSIVAEIDLHHSAIVRPSLRLVIRLGQIADPQRAPLPRLKWIVEHPVR